MISPFVNLNQISSDSTLYHYTGIGGTHGILQNKFIRATKSDFLNDSNEVRYILTIAQEVIHDVKNPVWQSILQTGIDITTYCPFPRNSTASHCGLSSETIPAIIWNFKAVSY